MLDIKNLQQLALVTANANKNAPTAYSFGDESFSYSALTDTLRKELNDLAGTPALFRENKNKLFALMEVVVDDVLPKKVMDMYGMFAEIKQFGQGEKAIFTQRVTSASRRRAKQFITRVGLAGVYETFKLDGRSFELKCTAYGGAAEIGLEEFLDGRVDFAELIDIVMEGLDEVIYKEIANELVAGINDLPVANVHSEAGFNVTEFDRLISIADSYNHATIYCTYEFATTLVPAEGWVADAHRVEKWNNGYLANYRGHNVIVLPQSFEDEKNERKVIDPSYCYIIPTGTEKPIKIAFEGQALVDEWKNRDWSRELQVYKKLGIGSIMSNGMCIYRNTALVR